MGGRTSDRNPVSLEKAAPLDWAVGHPPRNIRWSTGIGGHGIGGPVVADGLIWVGTNNTLPLDPAVKGEFGVLACFRESDGKFLYQHASPRIEPFQVGLDWPGNGLGGSPCTEPGRLWFVTNRREVICLDTRPLTSGDGPAGVLWKYDMRRELNVRPFAPMIGGHNTLGSPTIYRDWLYIPTGQGDDRFHPPLGAGERRLPAPSLVCLEKQTGKLVWSDKSPGTDIHHGQIASPLIVEVDGRAQVIHPQGDGWVRAFDAATGELIWRFDLNRKGLEWSFSDPQGTFKHVVMSTPVFSGGRVYFATGKDPEFCVGPGRFYCVDPSRRGDVSPELADGTGRGRPNPNSARLWEFTGTNRKEAETFHLTTSCVAVADGLVVAAYREGFVHCLDATDGRHQWTFDTLGSRFGDPLIVDGKIYVANDEGRVHVLELSRRLKLLSEQEVDGAVEASPVFANGTLYVMSQQMLYAISSRR